jgi:hypothetical protein
MVAAKKNIFLKKMGAIALDSEFRLIPRMTSRPQYCGQKYVSVAFVALRNCNFLGDRRLLLKTKSVKKNFEGFFF